MMYSTAAGMVKTIDIQHAFLVTLKVIVETYNNIFKWKGHSI